MPPTRARISTVSTASVCPTYSSKTVTGVAVSLMTDTSGGAGGGGALFRMQPRHVALRCLLWAYIWPFGLFRDASVGTALERWAAYRYNREQRVHLPVYAVKWTVLCAVWLAGAVYFELSWKSSASLGLWA